MSQQLYLRFPDRPTAQAVASALVGYAVESMHTDGWWPNPATGELVYWNLDDIGTLVDESGNALPGYHINGWWHSDDPVPDVLAVFQIFPETPFRVWG